MQLLNSNLICGKIITRESCFLICLLSHNRANIYDYLSDRMKNLLKNSGINFDIKTKDEADVILQGINLLENKLGLKQENVHKE